MNPIIRHASDRWADTTDVYRFGCAIAISVAALILGFQPLAWWASVLCVLIAREAAHALIVRDYLRIMTNPALASPELFAEMVEANSRAWRDAQARLIAMAPPPQNEESPTDGKKDA